MTKQTFGFVLTAALLAAPAAAQPSTDRAAQAQDRALQAQQRAVEAAARAADTVSSADVAEGLAVAQRLAGNADMLAAAFAGRQTYVQRDTAAQSAADDAARERDRAQRDRAN